MHLRIYPNREENGRMIKETSSWLHRELCCELKYPKKIYCGFFRGKLLRKFYFVREKCF